MPRSKGPAICLSLTGKAHGAALEILVEDLNSDTEIFQLLAKLDQLYPKGSVSKCCMHQF